MDRTQLISIGLRGLFSWRFELYSEGYDYNVATINGWLARLYIREPEIVVIFFDPAMDRWPFECGCFLQECIDNNIQFDATQQAIINQRLGEL